MGRSRGIAIVKDIGDTRISITDGVIYGTNVPVDQVDIPIDAVVYGDEGLQVGDYVQFEIASPYKIRDYGYLYWCLYTLPEILALAYGHGPYLEGLLDTSFTLRDQLMREYTHNESMLDGFCGTVESISGRLVILTNVRIECGTDVIAEELVIAARPDVDYILGMNHCITQTRWRASGSFLIPT